MKRKKSVEQVNEDARYLRLAKARAKGPFVPHEEVGRRFAFRRSGDL